MDLKKLNDYSFIKIGNKVLSPTNLLYELNDLTVEDFISQDQVSLFANKVEAQEHFAKNIDDIYSINKIQESNNVVVVTKTANNETAEKIKTIDCKPFEYKGFTIKSASKDGKNIYQATLADVVLESDTIKVAKEQIDGYVAAEVLTPEKLMPETALYPDKKADDSNQGDDENKIDNDDDTVEDARKEDVYKLDTANTDFQKDFIHAGVSNKTQIDIDPEQLEMGIKVEMEHTNIQEIAKKIALDHLQECKTYYTYLKEMEDKMKADGNFIASDGVKDNKSKEIGPINNPKFKELEEKVSLMNQQLEEQSKLLASYAIKEKILSLQKLAYEAINKNLLKVEVNKFAKKATKYDEAKKLAIEATVDDFVKQCLTQTDTQIEAFRNMVASTVIKNHIPLSNVFYSETANEATLNKSIWSKIK